MKTEGSIIDHPYSLQTFIADNTTSISLWLIAGYAACMIFIWLDRS